MAEQGWYHADGDPAGTVRYWDGTEWIGDPTPQDRVADRAVVAAPPAQVLPAMSPVDWIKRCFHLYADFRGRAPRPEFWWFSLMGFATLVVVEIISDASSIFGSFLGLVSFVTLIVPLLAVFTRRLHDTNRSGWWFLIGFVPFIGALVILYFLIEEGDPGENDYGPPVRSA